MCAKIVNPRKKAAAPAAEQKEPVKAAPDRRQAYSQRRASGSSDEQKRSTLLKESFCPEGLDWLKKNLGIDLASSRIPLQVVYDIASGCVTSEPVEAVVRPLAYDKKAKKSVEMPPVKVVGSFRIVMPYNRKTFEPVAPSKEQPVYVSCYPCYEMMQKAGIDGPVEAPAVDQAEVPRVVEFSDEMIKALEGIGIREDRLYKNAFNAVPDSEKIAMFKGDAFECTGTVRVVDGFDNRLNININGLGKLEMGKDGSVVARFEPQYPAESRAGQVVDLIRASVIGNLEIDIYERDSKGLVKRDVYKNPIINKAGKDLVRYGRSFGLMDGRTHVKEYKNGQFEERVDRGKYEVSIVNGGLCATPAKRVVELGEDGNPLTTVIGGKEVEKFHYESSLAKVVKDKDGSEIGVRVGGQVLKPASPKDLENYKRGVGGKFVGYETKDAKTGKKVVYDAYVVADNRRNGYGRAYSQKVSEDLFARQEEKKKAVRKQNYSMGI